MRRLAICFLIIFLLLKIQVLTTGCANIVPPAGGLRDSLPPILLKASPKDSSLNFQGNKIILSFDEYVETDNFFQNVIVTPIQKVQPTETHRLNTITIRLHDSLEANTTYIINFGSAIKDVNEGNVMKGFSYIFSTGPVIDSLSFSGNVILAETGRIDSTLTVMLHKKGDDSAVVKERPRYVSKLDNKGNFTFRNLPSGTFYVYALKDDTRSYRYLNNKVLFAFADSPVVVQQNVSPVTLYAYEAVKSTQPAASIPGLPNVADKRLKYQTSLKTNKVQDLLQPFSFRFDRKLKQFDSTKIHFAVDSSYTPVTGYSWLVDSTKKRAALSYSWKENTLYHLILEKDFATDSLGYQLLKGDTITFTTMKNSDYGKVSIRFRNLDLSKNPVLQFIQSGEVVAAFPLTGENFSRDLFLPGEYDMRILNDSNKNGKWDPGEFFSKHKQPEIVKPVERQLNVKPNWENELEIEAPSSSSKGGN